VGSFIYLSATRPDISQVIHILSQFVSAPTSIHYAALFCVLRYLRSTISRSLLYSSDPSLSPDAQWADDLDTRCPTTDFCIFLGSSLIFWRNKRQDVVSRSSTEAKYRATATITLEFRWLRDLLCDMSVSVVTSVPMHCDNKSVIIIASKPVFHDRTKHIEIHCHIIRQEYEKRHDHSSLYVPSRTQLAYLFTKAQTSTQFRQILFKLSIFDSP